jgi:hypothetical protein
MKINILFLIIAVFFGVVPIIAQTEKEVAAIRAEVGSINKNAKSYRQRVKDVDGISLEGTQATYFTSGKGLKKITAKMYGETFNASVELYYQDEKLIFAYQKINRYDTHIAMTPPPKVIKTEEKRLYFSAGKMIKLLVGKSTIKPANRQWDESETELIELAGALRAAY